MHFPAWIFAAFAALDLALFVSAGVYFIEPSTGSTCTAGQPCTLEWLDDGNTPLLNEVSVVTVGLYTGNMQLVQTIEPIDASGSLSVQFTPNAQAGPTSGTYYIAFISKNAKVNGTSYTAFSPFFNLKGMSGSFASPLASATSSIAIPTPLTRSSANTIGTTITVGNIDTSLPPLPTLSSTRKSNASSSSSSSPSSRFATSSIPNSSPAASASPSVTISSASSTAAASGALASRPPAFLLPILAVLSLSVLLLPSIS
ncbi:hypothetical protein C8R43DRAFT_1021169 [Mycena crocata]|nr:hypothetical protein C8R43DRAFT_1021169 [Mycena crocata]